MAGCPSGADVWGGAEGMLCLHMTAPLSGNTFLCNLACNANGGHLASKVLQQLSPEKPCHSHLFLDDRRLDLQQTVSENGLVDGSEVHYLINQATEEKRGLSRDFYSDVRGGQMEEWVSTRDAVQRVLQQFESSPGATSGTGFASGGANLVRAANHFVTRCAEILADVLMDSSGCNVRLLWGTRAKMAAMHCDTSWHQWPDKEDDTENEAVDQSVARPSSKRTRVVRIRSADEFINAQEGKTERWSLGGFGTLARGLESFDGMLRFLQDMRSAIDVVALREFEDAFALRMYAWENYRRQAPIWNLRDKERDYGVHLNMEQRRVGTPYRVLNKASVFLVFLMQVVLRHYGEDLGRAVRTLLLNILLFRAWFNSRAHMLQALARFQDLGGQVIQGTAFAIEGFLENLDWFHTAASSVNVNGTMRNNAYNPGTFGVAKGTPAVDGFVERLRNNFMPSLAWSLDRFISLWGASPSTATSEATLSYWQFLAEPFVGYQIALDTAYVSRGWFDAALVVFDGPGVPAEIKPAPPCALGREMAW